MTFVVGPSASPLDSVIEGCNQNLTALTGIPRTMPMQGYCGKRC